MYLKNYLCKNFYLTPLRKEGEDGAIDDQDFITNEANGWGYSHSEQHENGIKKDWKVELKRSSLWTSPIELKENLTKVFEILSKEECSEK